MSDQSRLEGEIEGLYRRLLDGWNRRDAAAMARCFAEHGSMVGFDGSPVDGRAEIEAHLTPIFADHPTARFVAVIREVRSLGPDVALLRAAAGMVPPGKSELNPATNAVQSLLCRHHDGVWRVEMFQNTPAAFHGRPEAAQALTEELTAEV
jgi:uncharacterized protein (TIGR02246 family)